MDLPRVSIKILQTNLVQTMLMAKGEKTNSNAFPKHHVFEALHQQNLTKSLIIRLVLCAPVVLLTINKIMLYPTCETQPLPIQTWKAIEDTTSITCNA